LPRGIEVGVVGVVGEFFLLLPLSFLVPQLLREREKKGLKEAFGRERGCLLI